MPLHSPVHRYAVQPCAPRGVSSVRRRGPSALARMAMLLLAGAMPAAAALAQVPAAADGVIARPADVQAGPRVKVTTSLGEFVLELYPDKAPRAVQNFQQYVRDGFYNGTVFHRVIPDLLIQAGAYTLDLRPKPARAPIPNEAKNGLPNLRGTIAAARAANPDSATSEFFINAVDNPRFDYTSDDSDYTRGYTVFGRVVEGMDVIDKIRAVPTQAQGNFTRDVPKVPVVIEKMEALAPAPAA